MKNSIHNSYGLAVLHVLPSYVSSLFPRLISLACLLSFFLPDIWGQAVTFSYDPAGNRTSRIITMPKYPSPKDSTGMNKSASGDAESQSEFASSQHYDDMLGERKVTIYPNPTQGLIRIDFQGYADGEMTDARLLLYDMNGRLLLQVNKPEPSHTLDLSSYPAGMYILQMMEGKAKSEWKIVKE